MEWENFFRGGHPKLDKIYPADVFEPTVVFESGEFSIMAIVRVKGQEGLNEFFGPSIFESS
jgi:hypothetical protein